MRLLAKNKNQAIRLFTLLLLSTLSISCGDFFEQLGAFSNQSDENSSLISKTATTGNILNMDDELVQLRPPSNPVKQAYYGDLHVHTAYSFDAYQFGTTITPEDAYRYAQGEKIRHPAGYDVQLNDPLDFYAVTDHGMYLGVVQQAADPMSAVGRLPFAKQVHHLNAPNNLGLSTIIQRGSLFANFAPALTDAIISGTLPQKTITDISKTAWSHIISAAEQANIPGRFTTFSAYEYTSSTNERGNLHRNIIFKDNDRLPALPFSRAHSTNPEDLWHWMDNLREQGIDSLAIPHNSNGSNGSMFQDTYFDGQPIDNDYSIQRMRNEPIVEMTQIKGTSDTHPLLSPNDEWANFEIAPYRVGTQLYSEPKGSYVRDAFLNGLVLAKKNGVNPYKFGLIGSSDTHTGASSIEEDNFFSKAGLIDSNAELRGAVPMSKLYGAITQWLAPQSVVTVDDKTYLRLSSFETWSASGLTAVWAEENTRDAIYAAFKRKEVFATTGPRIKLRFFAGTQLSTDLLQSQTGLLKLYQQAKTMGADLVLPNNHRPTFIVHAVADANSAPLQRVQIIKGTLDNDGNPIEQVFDIACSDNLEVDRNNWRCPNNNAKVNLNDCSISRHSGDGEILASWQDPDYNANEPSVYYVRVLENPTCRWSTWDAIRAGTSPRTDLPATIQERAWSSPIWVKSL